MKVFNQSVEGSSHVLNGTPCQDSSVSLKCERFSIIALSDGHGSKTYVRSHIGSKLACEISVELTKQFIENNYELLSQSNVISTYTPDLGKDQETKFQKLFTSINTEWNKAIEKDSLDNPFSDKEKFLLGHAPLKQAYGCTLLVAVKSENFTFIFHIGDGRIYTISYANDWELPVPWDNDCVDNVTTSLCEDNPVYRIRYYFNSTKNQPFIIFMCSDGIEDCYGGEHDANFQSEELVSDYGEVLRCFLEDDDFEESCSSFLNDQSKAMSHDDMSIAFIIDNKYDTENLWLNMVHISRKISEWRSKLKSLINRKDENQSRILRVKNNINHYDQEIERLNNNINQLSEEIGYFNSKIDSLEDCNKAGTEFRSYINDFPKRLQEYHDEYGECSNVSNFLSKLKGLVINGLRKIVESIQKELDSNKKTINSLKQKRELKQQELDNLESTVQRYSKEREAQLDKYTNLVDNQREYTKELDELQGTTNGAINKSLDEYDEVKNSIQNIITPYVDEQSSITEVNQYDSPANEEGDNKAQWLSISKFSQSDKDEDILIELSESSFKLIYNGNDLSEVNRPYWDIINDLIRNIGKDDIISKRSNNCLVISIPGSDKEKIFDLDSPNAKQLWDACITLIKDKK